MKILVKIDPKRDAANWWNGCNKISYSIDWKRRISKSLQNKLVNKTEKQAYRFLMPYLKKLYKKVKLEEIQKQLQAMFDVRAPRMFKEMERVTGKPIYRKSFICFLTTFSRAPYDPKHGYVWMPIQRGERTMNTFAHELLHFQTLYYYEKQMRRKLNEREKEHLKEALTVILNLEFKGVLPEQDYGYPIHKYLREDLFWFWNKHRNFKSLMSHGISVYPKYADTIKYLGFGAYTKSCPDLLFNKVKAVKGLRGSYAYISKVLRTIMGEFDPKNHKTTTTSILAKSRFIGVEDILHKRQTSCGSMATVVASVLRTLVIPAKLIDGKYLRNGVWRRHAWNEIYVAKQKKFIPFDITKPNFVVGKNHKRIVEYGDWSEMR